MTNKIIHQKNKLENLNTILREHSELKEKIKLLEAVVQNMFVNVIKLEAEVKNKKNCNFFLCFYSRFQPVRLVT